MFDYMFRRWRRISARHMVMFVPSRDREPNDGVAALLPHVRSALGRGFRHLVHLDRFRPHFRDVLKEFNITTRPRRVVLFAHPAPDNTGFAATPLNSPHENVLLLRWWQDDLAPVDLLIAHVCRGVGILERKAWRDQFPNWISYRCRLDAFLGTPRAVARWSRLATSIVDACAAETDTRRTADRIRAAYLREMIDIDENGDAASGDTLNLMYFQDAFDGIDTSDRE